jgi:hypothetical protein
MQKVLEHLQELARQAEPASRGYQRQLLNEVLFEVDQIIRELAGNDYDGNKLRWKVIRLLTRLDEAGLFQSLNGAWERPTPRGAKGDRSNIDRSAGFA